jgi:hypothetical protein
MLYGENQTHEINGQTFQGIKLLPYADGSKSAIVRMPAANEIAELFNTFAAKTKNETELEEKTRTAYFKLFKEIKVAGDDLDEYEAHRVLSMLLSSYSGDIERDGSNYKVTHKTSLGETVHTLRSLTAKERAQIRSASRSNPNSQVPGVTFYDTLVQGMPSGYAPFYTINDIPCHHKNQVISAVIIEYDTFDPVQIEFSPNS